MIIILVVLLLVVLAIVVTLAIVFTRDKDSKPDISTSKPILPPPTAPPGADGPYKHAVVASDAGPCSELGRDILKRGGTAVDSAVASLFCIGVYNMHSAGVGGGGFMVVYKKETRSVEVIDFREEAPGKANRTMYVGGKLKSRIGKLRLYKKFSLFSSLSISSYFFSLLHNHCLTSSHNLLSTLPESALRDETKERLRRRLYLFSAK